ncbi:uncharacterized protein LOC119083372 [Bradysia coprophila]|uniref:uncharacterized protein LOC119083372 n=1 Tax=Bradysia coprophila TaxID=38358 RepID=UPI00187D7AE9|nr:uncharacterized protein LOC119083372 [Bradysia coprophila]
MRTTWKNHRIMDLLLVAALLSGCILGTSSEDIKRSVDVQNIFNHFDALIKLKSTVPTVSDAVCVTSVDELNEIENAFVPDYDPETVLRDAEISIKISPDCAKLDRVKSEIIKLRNDFGIVIAQPISSQIYRTLKTSFESKIIQFVGSLEIAKKMESGDRLDMVVRFQNEFQPQQNRISEVLTKLETEQKRSNDANVQTAIEHLQRGKLDEAVAAFAIVTDHEAHVERAVMAVYGNEDDFPNICRFIVRLPKLSRENGYKVVRDQLKKDNRMVDRHIWVLAAEVSRIQEKDRGILNDVFVHIKTMVQNDDFDSIAVILNKTGVWKQ